MSSGINGNPLFYSRPITNGPVFYSQVANASRPHTVANVGNDALNAAKVSIQDAQKKLNNETAILKQANVDKATALASRKALSLSDPDYVSLYQQYSAEVTAAEKTITDHTKKQSDAQSALQKAETNFAIISKQLLQGKYVPPKTKPSPGGKNSNKDTSKTSKPIYKYNAPMVKSAYITRGVQVDSAGFDKLITDPGKLQDASKNWGTNQGAKGVIQMNRSFADMAPAASSKNNSNIVDPQMYGFKFLYNPTSISMAWGIVEQFSPQFEATAQDKASAISVGLMKSAITFTLMLNRMGDMAYIDANGLKNSHLTITDRVIDAQIRTPPYPSDVNFDELKMIYKRGTMYDLDYLFRATGGYSSQYHSTMLNGTTADRGWLQPMPVELHLGDGLRYLVRVSSLDVNHMIFNERMVPLLTSVNITCTRYFDGPEMFQTSNATAAFDLTTAAASAASAAQKAVK